MTFSLSAIPAHRGISDEKCTPGIEVGILLNGPLLGRPGLGSQVSNWLGAPQSHSKMQCFWARFTDAAKAGLWKSPVKLATEATPVAVRPLRKRRRCSTCSSVRHCPIPGVVDSADIFMAWLEILRWSSMPKASRASLLPVCLGGHPERPRLAPPHQHQAIGHIRREKLH